MTLPNGCPKTYARHRRGEPLLGRAFDTLDGTHPAHGQPCAACNTPLGDNPAQLAIIGPDPDDIGDARAHTAGRWYSALATIIHQACGPKWTEAMEDTR